MTARPHPPADKSRQRLLAAGWILLGTSVGLCLIGPRFNVSSLPEDFRRSISDVDWMGLGWIVGGMIVGALSLMCFLAQWVLRPRGTKNLQQPKSTTAR